MSLIAQYLFNGDGNDTIGGYNGTPENITYETIPREYNFNQGLKGKVAVFDKTSKSRIFLPAISSITGTAARTFEFWCYSEVSESKQYIFGYGTASITGDFECQCPCMTYNTSTYANTFHNNFQFGGYGSHGLVSSATFGSAWHHVAIVKPSGGNWSRCSFYFDGTSRSVSWNQNPSVNTGTNYPITLGASAVESSSPMFTGKLANFRIYDEALSASKIASDYQIESQPREDEATVPYELAFRHWRACRYATDFAREQ